MTTTATEEWAGEQTPAADIEKALRRQRLEREEEQGHGALARASVLNLVALTTDRDAGRRAVAAIEALGVRAPSRAIVLVAEPPEGKPGVRAWAHVVDQQIRGGPDLAYEQVVVQTNVHPKHLSAIVLPLLLPELPVFTWWTGTPPFDSELFAELAPFSDRLIVDSAAFADPLKDLVRFAKVGTVLARSVSDSAWGRLTAWRELIAAAFDVPELREAWERINWVRVDAHEATAGVLIGGWLASRLRWRLDAVRMVNGDRMARYVTSRHTCEVRVHGTSRPSGRVDLQVESDEGPASIRIEAATGHLVSTVEVPGRATTCRKVGATVATGDHGLAAELEVFGRDRIYEEALREAVRLAEAGR